MGTKVTSSSGSVLEEPEIQKLQMQAKIFRENSLNELKALKSTTQLLDIQSMWYQEAFARLFGDSFRTFEFQLSQHMNNLETLLNAETLHERDSKSALSVIKKEQVIEQKKELKMTLKRLSERQLQIEQCKVQEVQSSVTSSGDETSSGIVSDEEIDKQKLEAHYSYMAKIQEVSPEESSSTSAIGTEENKTVLKQLKKANASLTQELKECKTNIDKSSRALGEATSSRDSSLIALQTKQTELEKFCPDGEETVTLEKESRSKLDKDTVKPYNYTYQNSLYETFKPPSKAYLDQLER
ncbi:hypothetical protein Tco_0241422 [Tanacetum coccineum]